MGHNWLPLPHLYNPSAGCPAEYKPSRPETNTVRPRSDNERPSNCPSTEQTHRLAQCLKHSTVDNPCCDPNNNPALLQLRSGAVFLLQTKAPSDQNGQANC